MVKNRSLNNKEIQNYLSKIKYNFRIMKYIIDKLKCM